MRAPTGHVGGGGAQQLLCQRKATKPHRALMIHFLFLKQEFIF